MDTTGLGGENSLAILSSITCAKVVLENHKASEI